MPHEDTYETVYHRNDYTLADAFRPQPGWGTRTFTVPASKVGPCTESEMVEAAQDAAPTGYRLTSLSIYPFDGPKRVIWSTPVDQRFKSDNWAAATEGASHGQPT